MVKRRHKTISDSEIVTLADRKRQEKVRSKHRLLDHERRALVVGHILGRQFSHKDEIRIALERRLYLEDTASIVGLSLGWASSC
jgi:hypothetical protein